MRKTGRVVFRIFALTALTAGAGVAVLASNEEGRKQLSNLGEYLSNGWQFATQYVESFQNQSDITYKSYTPNSGNPVQQNGNQHVQGQYSQVR